MAYYRLLCLAALDFVDHAQLVQGDYRREYFQMVIVEFVLFNKEYFKPANVDFVLQDKAYLVVDVWIVTLESVLGTFSSYVEFLI